MEGITGVAVIIGVIALAFFVAPLGIWTEISRSRKAAERVAREQMEELKKIENAVKLCANMLSRSV